MTDQPETQPASSTSRSRASVSAQPAADRGVARPETAETPQPVEVEHTPTLPQGTVSNYAEPVTAIPPGTPVTVAADPTVNQAAPAAAPVVSSAPGQMEIAAPAPLPRPGDEQLTRGTAEHAVQQEELTGVAPEMPADPNSDEAQAHARELFEQQQQQEREAAESVAKRQEESQQRMQQRAGESR